MRPLLIAATTLVLTGISPLPLGAAEGGCALPDPQKPSLLKVAVPAGTRLTQGADVAGQLRSGGRAGTGVHFAVERAWKERTPGPKKSIWSWMLHPLDLPPRHAVIAASSVRMDGGQSMEGSVLRVAKGKKGERIVWFQTERPSPASGGPVGPLVIPAGTRLRVVLVSPLDSALNRNGDAVRAVLTDPVEIPGGTAEPMFLPAGTEITGRVSKAAGARWLHRPGRLGLAFQRIATPCQGVAAELSGSLTALDRHEASAFRVDGEGAVSGGPQSKWKLLLQVGTSYAFGKLVDDLMEEGLKGAAGAAAGTAATAARYPGLGLGLTLFAIQRGREVSLPAYQEIEITLSRAAELR